jgi:hypothetical protein
MNIMKIHIVYVGRRTFAPIIAYSTSNQLYMPTYKRSTRKLYRNEMVLVLEAEEVHMKNINGIDIGLLLPGLGKFKQTRILAVNYC